MKKKCSLAVVLAFFFIPSLTADNEKPFILVSPLAIEGVSADEARILESLIYSYIDNVGVALNPSEFSEGFDFTPNPEKGRMPDYTFSGSITLHDDGLILTLEVGGTGTGERASLTSVYKTAGELALNARSMVEAAFAGRNLSVGFGPVGETEGNAPTTAGTGSEGLTEEDILGTWRGETGIAMVRLRRGGNGIAVFSSGAQMNLLYSIEDNALNLVQNSPNTERYYQRQGASSVTIPYLVARQLAEEAEPMRWELFLYEKGTVLRGIKTASSIRYDLERILEITHGTIQKVEWIRMGR
jgi:hypothetical protein